LDWLSAIRQNFYGKYALLDCQSTSFYGFLEMKFGEDFLEAGVRSIAFSQPEEYC
jgi:hypothetical protein